MALVLVLVATRVVVDQVVLRTTLVKVVVRTDT